MKLSFFHKPTRALTLEEISRKEAQRYVRLPQVLKVLTEYKKSWYVALGVCVAYTVGHAIGRPEQATELAGSLGMGVGIFEAAIRTPQAL